ncbi:MAG: hypothetical protein ACW99U_22280 [Candidatus Thorarchaeota archaeon]
MESNRELREELKAEKDAQCDACAENHQEMKRLRKENERLNKRTLVAEWDLRDARVLLKEAWEYNSTDGQTRRPWEDVRAFLDGEKPIRGDKRRW